MPSCFDFTYANPSLWVIAGDNSWYRLAGPLVPSGCQPHPVYEPLLTPFVLKFVAAAHTAYCLIDLLPQNRKLSLAEVSAEIETRTGGLLNEQSLLANYEFISQHIETLVHPDDWDQQISFVDSVFLAQLKKKGQSHIKTNITNPPLPPNLPRLLFDNSLWRQNHDEPKSRSKRNLNSKKSSVISEEDPVCGQRTLKGTPIPIPDDELWEAQVNNGFIPPPYPFENVTLLSDPIRGSLSDLEMSYLPMVLRIWSILYNYQSILPTIPSYTLEELLSLLRQKQDSYWLEDTCPHILLREIHVACLELILKDRRSSEYSFTPVHDSQRGRHSSDHNFRLNTFQNTESENVDGIQGKPIDNCVTIWELLAQSTETNTRLILRTGETWVEIGRLLLTERSQYLVAKDGRGIFASEYADPIREVASLIENLTLSPQWQNFQSSKNSLPVILERILSGDYEKPSVTPSNNTFFGFFGQPLSVGDRVDAYCQVTRCWHEAKIQEISPGGSNDSKTTQIKVQIPHSWIHPIEVTFDLDSRWIAPLYSLSVNEQYRRVHPSHLPDNFLDSIRLSYGDRIQERDFPSVLSSLQAIASDVRSILQHDVDESNRDGLSPSDEATVQLRKTFEAGFATIIADLNSLSHHPDQMDFLSTKTLRQSDLPSLYRSLTNIPYSLLSFQSRVLFLDWLCGEMICSSTAKSFIDDVAERKWKFEKDVKAKRLQSVEQQDSEAEPEEEENSQRPSRSKRPRSQNYKNLDPPSPPKKGRVKYVSDPNVNLVEEEAFLSKVELRFQPLGADRNWRRYWRFAHDKHPTRLFCESPDGEDWFILSKQSQFHELINWLSIWGKNESKLKHGLLCWESKGAVLNYDDTFPIPISRIQDRYEAFLGSPDRNPSVHTITLTLTETGQIEAGVKDIERRIILTTFKLNANGRSAAHSSGLKIADQILSVNGVWIEDIQTLQHTLKAAQSSVHPGNCAVLQVLVLRYKQPTRCPLLRVASESDPDFKKWMDPKSAVPPLPDMDSPPVFHSLIGSIIELVYSLCEPWLTNSRWIQYAKPTLITLMNQLSTNTLPTCLLATLKDLLLHAESGLWYCKRALKKWWMSKRTHFRWRIATMNITCYAALCSSFAILQQAIDWPIVEGVQSCVTLSKCRELLPKHSLESYLPTVGDKFLYYPDGHLNCLDILRLRYQFELPLCQFNSHTLESLTGRVFLCQAINIRYYPGGAKGMLDKSCPYYRLDLRVLPCSDEPFPPTPILQLPQQEGNDFKKHRLFNRVLNILYGLPEGEPFINPVSTAECPDYYDVISQPMHLVEVAKRVKQQTYQTPEDFLRDISLIRSNCIEYCSERFPALVADAEILYETAVAALQQMNSEFETSLVPLSVAECPNDDSMNIVNGRSIPFSLLFCLDHPSPPPFSGEIWTIFVPLNKSLTEIDFLVSVAIYIKACTKRQYFLEDKVCMRKGTFHVAASNSDVLESQYVLSIHI